MPGCFFTVRTAAFSGGAFDAPPGSGLARSWDAKPRTVTVAVTLAFEQRYGENVRRATLSWARARKTGGAQRRQRRTRTRQSRAAPVFGGAPPSCPRTLLPSAARPRLRWRAP